MHNSKQPSPLEHIKDAVSEKMKEGWGRWKIARHFQISDGQTRRLMQRIQREAFKGIDIPGMDLERACVHVRTDANGTEIVEAWPRFKQSPEADGIMRAVQEFKLPEAPKILPPRKHLDADLLNFYAISDYHLGAYAWARETGEAWNCEIASSLLIKSLCEMMQRSPDAKAGLLCVLGDFLHWDGLDAVTPTSKHILDADTRFYRVAELALHLLVQVVYLMLRRHETVYVNVCEGNHDIASSVWLKVALTQVFARNGRVIIDNTPAPFYARQWGQTMLCMHHSHTKKMKDLPGFFASDERFRAIWGDCKYSYIHTGHYHHERMHEDRGAIVEQHPTLAAKDAHAARHGYASSRGAKCITYHKRLGEVSRLTVRPDVTEAA